jgi:hypothetical protein
MKKALLFGIGLVILILAVYLFLPVWNIWFFDIAFLLLIPAALLLLLTLKDPKQKKAAPLPVSFRRPLLFLVGFLLGYLTVFPILSSWALFYNQDYRNLIGKVKEGNSMNQQISPISVDEVRVVDEDLAHLLGEKILGTQPALGSQVELGEFCIQKVNNKLYWVAPLLHSGFFKWINNQEGTPGYVMVSATNERDVRLVQTANNQAVRLRFQPSAFFGDDIHRHVYMNGYAGIGLEDFSFEVDDQGKPFWVITCFDKKVGFFGEDANGVLVVDAQSGDIQAYTLANMPAWIDRAQPITFIESQLNDWGEYIHGYWNFSNADKLTITEDLTLVYGPNSRAYWYTGVTSVGKDESAVGFVLIDTRTKETTFYRQSGATEAAAQSSAEGKVQEKGYKASLPIPYTINGVPTYVMTLKDDGGLVKMYAMVALHDYTIVGVGNSLRETLSAYKSVYNTGSGTISPDAQAKRQTVHTQVTRISTDVRNGTSYYYMRLAGQPLLFVTTSQLSASIPLTQPGDEVEIAFDRDTQEVQDLTYFKNWSLANGAKVAEEK